MDIKQFFPEHVANAPLKNPNDIEHRETTEVDNLGRHARLRKDYPQFYRGREWTNEDLELSPDEVFGTRWNLAGCLAGVTFGFSS